MKKSRNNSYESSKVFEKLRERLRKLRFSRRLRWAIDIVESKIFGRMLDRESQGLNKFGSTSTWGQKFARLTNKKAFVTSHK